MPRLAGCDPTARWLLPVLVVILVLGHVCELPAFVDLVSHHHSTEGHDHSAERHADAQLDACDPLTAASGSCQVRILASVDAAVALPAIAVEPTRTVLPAPDGPEQLPPRSQLFLLYASLLI